MKGIAHSLLSVAVLLSAALGSPSARGQDDDVAEEVQQVPAPQFMFHLNEQQFDMWAFGNRGNAETIRDTFDSLLSGKMLSVNRLCGLTPAQRKKLALAGRGDIKRYFDQIEEKRAKYLGTITDQGAFNEAIRDINSLQSPLDTGLFGEGSLFEKTLATVVSKEQSDMYHQALQERRLFVYRAKVELATALLGNTLGLTAEQREKIGTLLFAETLPAKKHSNYDNYVILYQAARLPEEKLRPIFRDSQWLALQRIFARAIALGPMLKQNGVLPELGRDLSGREGVMRIPARQGFLGR